MLCLASIHRSQLARQRSSTVAYSSTNREKLKLFSRRLSLVTFFAAKESDNMRKGRELRST